jgi:hypothetical protein
VNEKHQTKEISQQQGERVSSKVACFTELVSVPVEERDADVLGDRM